MRKKEILAIAFNSIIPQKYFAKIRSIFINDIIILAYHRVKTIANYNDYQFDEELISASTDQFEYQMKYIRKYYNPISEEQLINSLKSGLKLPPRSVLVTFDDGFDDNYNYAFPILKKYAIPAVVFIATDFIDSREPIWFDWLAGLIFSSNEKTIKIDKLDVEYVRGDRSVNRLILSDLIVKIRKLDNLTRLQIIDQLKTGYGNTLNVSYAESRGLTWDQVREMNESGITFGSHTVTHPILSRLKLEDVQKELSISKEIIESKIGKKINSLAYPTGMDDSFTKEVVKLAKKTGYEVAYTYIHGNNKLPLEEVYKLKRLHVENHINNAYFNTMLNCPSIFKD